MRSIAPASLIDEQAFKLIGEPPAHVEMMLAGMRHEVADGMASCNPAPSRSKIFGTSLAFRELGIDRDDARRAKRGEAEKAVSPRNFSLDNTRVAWGLTVGPSPIQIHQ